MGSLLSKIGVEGILDALKYLVGLLGRVYLLQQSRLFLLTHDRHTLVGESLETLQEHIHSVVVSFLLKLPFLNPFDKFVLNSLQE